MDQNMMMRMGQLPQFGQMRPQMQPQMQFPPLGGQQMQPFGVQQGQPQSHPMQPPGQLPQFGQMQNPMGQHDDKGMFGPSMFGDGMMGHGMMGGGMPPWLRGGINPFANMGGGYGGY